MRIQQRGIVPRKLKGMRDIDPALNRLKWDIIDRASGVYKNYGFEHWDTPVLEYADVLGKYLPNENEITEGEVEGGVYSFRNPEKEPVLDLNGSEIRDEWGRVIMENHFVALRYDLTAPLARLYAEKLWMTKLKSILSSEKATLFRRFQYGPVFRFEPKLDPGRFREFWQLDFDSVGSNDITSDAEVCMILSDAMEAIGLKRKTYVVNVNNRKILKGFLKSLGIKKEANEQNILRVIDKFDKINIKGLEEELGKGRIDSSGAVIKGLGVEKNIIISIINFFEEFEHSGNRKLTLNQLESRNIIDEDYQEGLKELLKIDKILKDVDYDENRVIFSPTLVRGMGYYTGPVFEVESLQIYIDERGRERKVGAICGGGRYDDLVERLLGIKVPATGASIGVDRLAELLLLTKQVQSTITGPVLIVNFGENYMLEYQKLAKQLREKNIFTEIYYGIQKGLNKQLSYADKKNSPIALLLGEDEFKKNVITIRNLQYGKEIAKAFSNKKEWQERVQFEVDMNDVVSKVKQILSKLKFH